ncbi:CCA tRNA nucleotidyltransferase [Streptomonospora wellingtoniae]|uniref:CCA tRNA nucleotidyltransferase n=1 Tax=Streptomonospora wellingtoniae TaxID=3075544 RepID=A0ABU2KRU9_9ACTN|nr:CCA tRNA nucleotidyltransferase [Streptomonospora sp. DSM 45055]MDT0301980.1 CCA tRNA nucleotidyltransferase [Streptomonospora sp. DSM 45055]
MPNTAFPGESPREPAGGTAPTVPGDLTDKQRAAITALFGSIDSVVQELGERFSAGGHELAMVGGPVRDAVLGREVHDFDLTTDAVPQTILSLVEGWADAVWTVGIDFGTVGLRKGGLQLEITTYRSESYQPKSRKPEVHYGSSLHDDLLRRDFTVNAMAVRLPEREFVDPFGGLADLKAARLRTPGLPEDSFSDDPLRVMRAVRFAAQLGMTPAPEVREAASAMADRLAIVSAERVRDELTKLMLSGDPRTGVELMVDFGIADHVLPEIPRMRLEIDEHHRHKDVYDHSLTVLDQAIELERKRGMQPDLVLRLAALLHDIGKPKTRAFESGGRVTFHHHEVVGASMSKSRLSALRFPKDVTAAVGKLVALHLRFHGYGKGEWTDSAVRRYARDAGDQLQRLHVLTRADCTTRNRRKAAALARAYDDIERRIDRLAEEEELNKVRPDLDGNEIQQILDIGPGPMIGKAWRFLLELRLENGPMDKEAAAEELRSWARRHLEESGGAGGAEQHAERSE